MTELKNVEADLSRFRIPALLLAAASMGRDPSSGEPHNSFIADVVVSGHHHVYERLNVGPVGNKIPYIINSAMGAALGWNSPAAAGTPSICCFTASSSHDVGTSAVKALAVDDRGDVLAHVNAVNVAVNWRLKPLESALRSPTPTRVSAQRRRARWDPPGALAVASLCGARTLDQRGARS